jgi:hypothetical protein
MPGAFLVLVAFDSGCGRSEIFKFSFLLHFEKRLEMVHRTDPNIAPGVPE